MNMRKRIDGIILYLVEDLIPRQIEKLKVGDVTPGLAEELAATLVQARAFQLADFDRDVDPMDPNSRYAVMVHTRYESRFVSEWKRTGDLFYMDSDPSAALRMSCAEAQKFHKEIPGHCPVMVVQIVAENHLEELISAYNLDKQLDAEAKAKAKAKEEPDEESSAQQVDRVWDALNKSDVDDQRVINAIKAIVDDGHGNSAVTAANLPDLEDLIRGHAYWYLSGKIAQAGQAARVSVSANNIVTMAQAHITGTVHMSAFTNDVMARRVVPITKAAFEAELEQRLGFVSAVKRRLDSSAPSKQQATDSTDRRAFAGDIILNGTRQRLEWPGNSIDYADIVRLTFGASVAPDSRYLVTVRQRGPVPLSASINPGDSAILVQGLVINCVKE